LQNEIDVKKGELEEINSSYNHILSQNTKLVEQLKLFEKESFEIQNKIRRGFEVEKENENYSRNVDTLRNAERELGR